MRVRPAARRPEQRVRRRRRAVGPVRQAAVRPPRLRRDRGRRLPAQGRPTRWRSARASRRVDPEEVHEVAFRKPRIGSRGYDEDEVDAFLDLVEGELRWRVQPGGAGRAGRPAGGRHRRCRQWLRAAGGDGGPVRRPGCGRAGRPAVRAVTVALLADRGRMLVTEMADPTTGRTAYRPPGGEIAFGERGHEAVRRTLREEFGIAAGRGAADGDAGEHPPLRRAGRARAGAGLRGGDRGPAGVVAAAADEPARRRHRDLGAGGHVPPQRGPLLPDGLLPLLG